MHNIKDIRNDFENFKEKLKNRNIDISLDNILSLDGENRKLIQEKEKFEMEKKSISKSKDQSLFEKSTDLSLKIEEINKNQIKLQRQITDILSSIPNIPLSDVPIGQDENSNKEIEKKGEIKKFNFNPKSHFELGEKLKMLNFDLATKTTGSRFVFVKGKLANLERALINFMIDFHTNENDYEEISPPLIANENTMYGTGQLPKFENDQFEIKTENNLSLIHI